jgi:hypothetical protein
MNISQAYGVLKNQIETERTKKGRPLTHDAVLTIDAALSDEKNFGNEVVQCIGCGMVTSILITEQGCPNCGCLDLDTKIGE